MIVVPRALPDDPWLKVSPPRWRPARLVDGRRTATMSCPNGHVCSLSDHHIDAEGHVTPSAQCPVEWKAKDQSVLCRECGFHDYVQLEGWVA